MSDKKKVCPILFSTIARDLPNVPLEYRDIYLLDISENAKCLTDSCEWYKQGCPAHPQVIVIN